MGKGGVALGAGPERVDYAPRASWADDWGVLKAMWFAQHDATGEAGAHQTRLENFYKSQAELYDGYRHRMLHGRKPMIENMPAPSGGTWLDLGGGTGSNLEYFGPNLDHFARVTVLDLTPSLVAVAKDRVARNGWSNVQVICGDATDPSTPGLPPAGSVDVVTISYALTMIPEWRKAVANAKRLLKRGGHLCVCDFTVDPGTQSRLMQAVFTKVFATDHVHLSAEHVRFLQGEFNERLLLRQYGSFPYVPGIIKSAYYVFIGQKK